MPANTLTEPVVELADEATGVSRRLVRQFKAQVEDWYDVCRGVSDWEDRYLVDDTTEDRLREHTRILDDLEQVGQWLSLATRSPDFPDRTTADLVVMALQDLKDRRALWHGKMTPQQREEVLRTVFNES